VGFTWKCDESKAKQSNTLLQYDAFLESATSFKSEDDKVAHDRDIFGFFMGFRKDQPVADSTENILLAC
jgi:hypothetical protein